MGHKFIHIVLFTTQGLLAQCSVTTIYAALKVGFLGVVFALGEQIIAGWTWLGVLPVDFAVKFALYGRGFTNVGVELSID